MLTALNGWTVQLTRCAHLDLIGTDEVYAVNLVFPWHGEDEPPFMKGDLQGPSVVGGSVWTGKHAWCAPWQWEPTVNWLLYGIKSAPGSTWTRIAGNWPSESGTSAYEPGTATEMTTALDQDIETQVKACAHAYSVAIDDAGVPETDPGTGRALVSGVTRSIPHALAPMTHWPAGVSNGLLRFGAFFRVDLATAQVGDYDRVACFPAFTADGQPFEPNDIKEIKSLGDNSIRLIGKTQDFGVVCNAVTRKTNVALAQKPAPPPVAGQAVSPETIRALLTTCFMPFQVRTRAVARYIALRDGAPPASGLSDASLLAEWDKLNTVLSDPTLPDDARAEWRAALWLSLPNGWSERYQGVGNATQPTRVHVLQYYVPLAARDRFNAALDALTIPQGKDRNPSGDPAAFGAMLDELSKTGSKDPASAAARRWTDAKVSWQMLMPNALGNDGDFLKHWLDLAHTLTDSDAVREITTPWFKTLFDTGMNNGACADVWRELVSPTRGQAALVDIRLPAALAQRAALGLLDQSDDANLAGVRIITLAQSTPLDAAALAKRMRAALSGAVAAAQMPKLDELATAAANMLIESINVQSSPDTVRAHDRGISLSFETAAPSPGVDQLIRGYAIALASGLQAGAKDDWFVDIHRAQWITDAAILLKGNWVQQSNALIWVHECIGSTLRSGVRVTSAEYLGQPLCALLADAAGNVLSQHDEPDTPAQAPNIVEFRWSVPQLSDKAPVVGARRLPLLGYGQFYKATTTQIDNAGSVVETSLRDTTHYAALKPASDVFNEPAVVAQLPALPYRSSVPPGSPEVFSGQPDETACALSADTRARVYQLQLWRANPSGPVEKALRPVAFLTHADQVDKTPIFNRQSGPYTLEAVAPSAASDFIVRWLNTDILINEFEQQGMPAALGSLAASDPNFREDNIKEQTAFRDAFLARAERRRDDTPSGYHPAVSHIGVAVWFDDSTTAFDCYAIPVLRTHIDANGAIAIATRSERRVIVTVACDSAATRSTARWAASTVTVSLCRGSFARVRLFSLVADAFFDASQGSTCRFAERLGLASQDSWTPAFKGFRAFSPDEHWFEAAPVWPQANAPDTRFDYALALEASQEADAQTTDHARLMVRRPSASAAWVKSLRVQRHEWHWTGYPVRPPAQAGSTNTDSTELKAWFTSFSGVQSYRDEFDAALPSATKGAAWTYDTDSNGDIVLVPIGLSAGSRPARYAAYFARPVIRFEAWLTRSIAAKGVWKQGIVAAGAIIPGRSPVSRGERIPTPVLRLAVPLTMNYRGASDERGQDGTGTGLERIANGNLLCFDDILRRTDDQATSGGIGDTLEIDLAPTDCDAYQNEVGANPIFHAAATLSSPELVTHDPFGLTYDISSNAKVAQTACIVSIRNGGGRWLMGKIRARRIILPETQLANRIAENRPPDPVPSFDLPTRVVGKDNVPMDFAIDTDISPGPWLITIKIATALATQTLTVPVPVLGKDDFTRIAASQSTSKLRLLCSWHKDQWPPPHPGVRNPNDPPILTETLTWRMQVLIQCVEDGLLPWRTIARHSCFDMSASTLNTHLLISRSTLTFSSPGNVAGHVPVVREVWMSDYTEPAWLTFIGSFGKECMGNPDNYALSENGKTLTLRAALSAPMPELSKREPLKPCFHMLLVFKPVSSAILADGAYGGGALVATYIAAGNGPDFASLPMAIAAPASLVGCQAYLMTVQQITAASTQEQDNVSKAKTFEELIECMFPSGPDVRESSLRLLPEYLGPIPITK